jgi:hypothetical protein
MITAIMFTTFTLFTPIWYGFNDMNYRLTDEENEICRELSKAGIGNHVFYLNDIFEEFGDFYYFFTETLPQLEAYSFLKAYSFIISDKENLYIEDIFLNKYYQLVKRGEIELAQKCASDLEMNILNLVLDDKVSINFIENFDIKNTFFKQLGTGTHVDYDFIELFAIRIEINKDLIEYLEKLPPTHLETEIIDLKPKKIAQFDNEQCVVRYGSDCCKIRKFSNQFSLLTVIFLEPKKDWQFSEIAEKIDPLDDINWKKLHSVALAINSKIAATLHLQNFFITTSQSVKINPVYIIEKQTSVFEDF